MIAFCAQTHCREANSWDDLYDVFQASLSNDLQMIESSYNAMLSSQAFLGATEDVAINWTSSVLSPVPYNSYSDTTIHVRNNLDYAITAVNINILNSDGLSLAPLSSAQDIAGEGEGSFGFRINTSSNDQPQRRVKANIQWTDQGETRTKDFLFPIQVTMPFQIPFVRPVKGLLELGESSA